MIGGLFIWQQLSSSRSFNAEIATVGPLGAFVFFWFGLALLHRREFASAMHRALSEMGLGVCRRCGYLLIGLQEEVKRCPECGAPRSVQREPIPWDDDSRRALQECGFNACTECGTVFKDSESACPECGTELIH